jgi:hypothetical protein
MRKLILHKECGIIKGMVDKELLPRDLAYPISLFVNDVSLVVISANYNQSFSL